MKAKEIYLFSTVSEENEENRMNNTNPVYILALAQGYHRVTKIFTWRRSSI